MYPTTQSSLNSSTGIYRQETLSRDKLTRSPLLEELRECVSLLKDVMSKRKELEREKELERRSSEKVDFRIPVAESDKASEQL